MINPTSNITFNIKFVEKEFQAISLLRPSLNSTAIWKKNPENPDFGKIRTRFFYTDYKPSALRIHYLVWSIGRSKFINLRALLQSRDFE